MIDRTLSIVLAALLVGLAACASKGAPMATAAASTSVTAQGPAAAAAAAALGPISDPGIPKGACGMVLWTLDNERPNAVFRFVSGKTAEIVLNGAPTKLTLTESAGAAGFGVHERQTFSGPGGLTVRVETRFSLGFDGGSYLERGVISIDGPDGWRTVAPAAGLAGCRSN